MKVLRTPDKYFKRLSNYPFLPHYLEVDGMRMHYVDEAPIGTAPSGHTVLMLHGEPSWSYLYRFMIPICAAAGHRVVAPDLIGFGRSDKPAAIGDYSYAGHVAWLRQFIEQLDLKHVTLVCQDWGSLLGLRLATEMEERFSAIAIGNGFLPTGEQNVPFAFHAWQKFARFSPWFPISRIIDLGSFRSLSKDERRAYDAPFPSAKYKAGARAFPRLVPTSKDSKGASENRAAWGVLERWEKPFLTAFSNGDPIMRGGDRYFQERVPGCRGMPHVTLKGGHFLQEDSGTEFAQAVNAMLAKMKKPRGSKTATSSRRRTSKSSTASH